MSAPVCRYFLNNNCRFGDRCRFSHAVSESGYGSDQSPPNPYVLNRNQSHNRQAYNEPKSNWKQNITYNDIQELIEKIRDEAKSVEFENLWPLTCLSVMKEGANVPGWEDYSMEELRTAAYSAKVTGRFNEYVRFHQTLLQKAKEARSIFLHPGKRAEEVVKAMLEKRSPDEGKSGSNFSFAQVPAFSGLASSSAVASASSSGSIFGGSPASTPGRAFTSTPIGSGGSDPAPGLFAMAAQGFTANTSQGSALNDTDMETASESLLNQSSTSTTSPFERNVFGQAAQKSGFPAQGSVFGGTGATSSSVFGGTSGKPADVSRTSSSVFSGAPASSSVFGGPPPASSVFGAPAATSSTSRQGTSGSDVDSNGVYTPISELSESDLEQFKAETFTLSKLPLVPPPKELC